MAGRDGGKKPPDFSYRPPSPFSLTLAKVSAKSAHGRFHFKDLLENPNRP